MSHEAIVRLLEDQSEVIEALHRQISTHENIRRILENLNSQALTILEQNASRNIDILPISL